MNIVFILEYMGYFANIDFTHTAAEGLVWISETRPKPEDMDIQNAWDFFKENEDTYQLDAEITSALNRIDDIASTKKLQYISGGVGQELIYSEKAKQAQEFKDGGYINPENYQFISMEADALNKTPQEVADTILANRTAWMQLGAFIESLRLSTKAAAREATGLIQLDSIIAGFKSTLDGI
jgi:hypothetical protein